MAVLRCGIALRALVAASLLATPAIAAPLSQTQQTVETAGSVVAIALPVIAGGISLYKHDRRGTFDLVAATLLSVGTAYALKNIVRERRPDGSDFQSFPSDTTALSASGSSFLWRRYGWEYGLPASIASSFVSYSRTEANRHHWYDTLAGSAIAGGYSLLITPRFKRNYHITTEIQPAPDGGMIRMSYNW